MNEIQLDVQIRNEKGRRIVKKLRQENIVPAVVYGGEKKGPTNIQLNKRSYEKIARAHKGQSVLFHINVLEGEKKLRDYSAIVKEEQHHPLSDDLLHVDFLRVSLKEEIEVQAPIVLTGEAEGVKKDGGSLDQPLHELSVLCLPTSIPEKIEHDISELMIGDAVHVSDLKMPVGVKTTTDPEAIVASIVPPMKEEEPVEIDEEEEPEITSEKKEEEGEAQEGEAEEKAEEAPQEGKSEKE